MKYINKAHMPDDADTRRAVAPVICYPTDSLPTAGASILADARQSLEKIEEANESIYERTGIRIDDVRDRNSIFTSKGREYTQEITSTTQAVKIKNSLEKNKIPVIENMYSNEMLKKVSTLYLQDILLYCNEIESGIPELNYWIQRAISEE